MNDFSCEAPFFAAADAAVAAEWRPNDSGTFPNTIDSERLRGQEYGGGAEESGISTPATAQSLAAVLDLIVRAGASNRPPSVRRAWSGFIALLDLLRASMLHGLDQQTKAAIAGVSKPTYVRIVHELSRAAGIPLENSKTAEHRANIGSAVAASKRSSVVIRRAAA
jgi:hypothetical protein